MNKVKKILAAVLCASVVAAGAVAPVSAVEKDGYVYGTMQIPYAEFYSAEGDADVDAVSSATTSKWKNENLVGGSYNDGNGTILGVTYNVAISASDLAALGENNYNFTESDSVPAAYKEVTVKDGKASFSEVKGSDNALADASATLSTSTVWGDYQITVSGLPATIGTVYGVALHTTSGDEYGMRHLENIWRNSNIGWSSGIKTTEPHGNTLNAENYVSLMGKTIDKITYITADGYYDISVSLYVPYKFTNEVNVKEAASGTGKTTFSVSGFPSAYSKNYSVEGLDCTISGTSISYKNAMPGSYTLTISDKKGKYADVTSDFVLSTDETPVEYKDGKISAVSSSADAANYIKNIATVTVNGTAYSATGKRAVKIVGEDGTIDTSAKSNDTAIFTGNDTVVITSTGYKNDYTFTIGEGTAVAETTPAETVPSSSETPAASSDDVVTADRPSGTSGTYTVQKGDTLWSIAEAKLGKGSRYTEIASLNNIKVPAKIQPGTVLVLPE